MKVTIITCVFNGVSFIEACIASVLAQNYQCIEYIVIDGGSTDGTLAVIYNYLDRIDRFEIGSDCGFYDALNKGIALASGEIVGVLNSDDLFADDEVVSAIVNCFRRNSCDAVYGNLNLVSRTEVGRILRCWNSKEATREDIESGWMPAHPALFLKRALFQSFGNYVLTLGCSADYELVLRFFYVRKIKSFFLNRLLVVMRSGGMSSRSVSIRCLTLWTDYHALKRNKIPFPIKALFVKKVGKLKQLRLW